MIRSNFFASSSRARSSELPISNSILGNLLLKYFHDTGQPFIAEDTLRAHLEFAPVSGGSLGDLEFRVLKGLNDMFGCLQQLLAGCRQDHFSAGSEKQVHLQLAFNVLQLLAEGGLGKKQPVRGPWSCSRSQQWSGSSAGV